MLWVAGRGNALVLRAPGRVVVAFRLLELGIPSGGDDLEHLTGPAGELGALGVGAVGQVAAAAGVSDQLIARVLGEVQAANQVSAGVHELLGAQAVPWAMSLEIMLCTPGSSVRPR